MARDFVVTVHGPRGAEWLAAVGTNRFFVRSPIPELVGFDIPDVAPALAYLLDLGETPADLLARIVAHLSRKFGVPADETAAELARHGVPILADDCGLMVLNPQRWFD